MKELSLVLGATLVLAACGVTEGQQTDDAAADGATIDATVDGAQESDGSLPPPGCGEEPIGLASIAHLDRLAYLRPAVVPRAFTSSDPGAEWGNDDFSQYLASSGAEVTLFDARGPGLVTRFWHTEQPALQGEYRFYFDGEAQPSLVLSRSALRGAGQGAFVPPLALNPQASSGGLVSYVPLAFTRSLRITETNPSTKDYYQIDYASVEDGRTMTSGVANAERATVDALFANVGTRPTQARADETTASGELATIAAGTTQTVADIAGPSEIVALRFHVPLGPGGNARAAVESARLQITWDGASSPAVDAPLAMFFGHGNGVRDSLRALVVGNAPPGGTTSDFYCYLPMPFATSAHIAIKQQSGKPALSHIGFAITHRPFPAGDLERVGRFHAIHRITPDGQGQLASISEKSGSFVGIVLVPPAGGSLEGDERTYIDGLATATTRGTGMEDYFNGAWYYEGGTFSRPLHGAVLDTDATDGSNRVSQYRFHLSDLVPFSRGFRLTWEVTTGAEALLYLYLRDAPTLERTDSLNIADVSSESAHGYMVTGTSTQPSLSSWLVSSNFTDAGRRLTTAATSTFHVAVDAANDGVVLRRLWNRADGIARAEVFVEGVSAGIWETRAKGPSDIGWRETDYRLPAALTRGRTTLAISIVVQSAAWSEYRYEAFSHVDLASECR